MTEETKNYFEELNGIDVSEKVEKKGRLSYLSWAWAWSELKKRHPNASSKVYETETGRIYFDDGRTCWVKVSVTINDIEHIEYLPVMDNRNRPINVESVTSFHANTSIQRAITKAIARHGLGLYIYAGEDLPEGVEPEPDYDTSQSKEIRERAEKAIEECGSLESAEKLRTGLEKMKQEKRMTNYDYKEVDKKLKEIEVHFGNLEMDKGATA